MSTLSSEERFHETCGEPDCPKCVNLDAPRTVTSKEIVLERAIGGLRLDAKNYPDTVFGANAKALLDEIEQLRARLSPETTVTVGEFDRYQRCLYRANGRLILLGQEPEKLEYSEEPQGRPGSNSPQLPPETPAAREHWCGDPACSPVKETVSPPKSETEQVVEFFVRTTDAEVVSSPVKGEING